MANQTGMQGTSGSTSAGRMQGATGVSDPIYNLISVVYHALQGAETYQKYEQDAQGDQNLAQFFRQACEEEKRRAQQGRELLAQALQRQGGSQQLQGGTGGQQRGGGSSQQNQSGSSGQQGGTGASNQQSQSGSSSRQMGSSSSPSSQQSQSGSSQRGGSSQMGSSAQGSSSQHGSSSSDRSRR